MVHSTPATILIGLSLDQEDSQQILSWAIRVLAQQNDTIVALHVLVDEDKRNRKSAKRQSKLRQAKAHVISVLGEFARSCRSKQVNLEARVKLGSTVGKSLIEEAKFISADFLLLRGSRQQSKKNWHEIYKYCFERAPEDCTVVLVGKGGKGQQPTHANSSNTRDNHQSRFKWPGEKNQSGGTEAPASNHSIPQKKKESTSPRTVLDQLEGEYTSTEDDTFSTRVSTFTETTSQASTLHSQSKPRKPLSPCKLFTAILGSPFRKRKNSSSNKEKKQPLLKCFSYEEISIATNNFDPENVVGRGGYSEVYRGDLSNGRTIAVKRLAKDNNDANKEKEFLMELGVIGHVCHPNTANLVGCCVENGLYLIFHLSQNGNLATALHGRTCKPLNWSIRYKIAIGVARGLHYLHECCKHRIIHRDIKASNVLLGPDYEPQITDFGLAKWLPNKWTHHAVIPIEGTFGYLAPEYFMHGTVDEKTDVYAFGILLLEIITGRRPVDSSKQNLLLWAKPLMESGKMAELADPKLEGKYETEQFHRVLLTASYCVRQSPLWRPTMSEVLELLTKGDDSESPKSWKIPKKLASDDLDDYSMIFGYDVPTDIDLEDYL